jgi:hypothetical protein
MSSIPALNAPNSETYPILTVAQIDRLRAARRAEKRREGNVLYLLGRCHSAVVSLVSTCVKIEE